MVLRWMLNALALILISYLVPGFHIGSFFSALVAALVLGLVNVLIRPIILLLTLPLTLLTLGLFVFVVNALMLLLVSDVVKGVTIDSFGAAFVGAVILWVMSMTIDWFFSPKLVKHVR